MGPKVGKGAVGGVVGRAARLGWRALGGRVPASVTQGCARRGRV